MNDKKEVQKSLIQEHEEKVSEEEFFNVLKSVAPGTNLRTALDGALKVGHGALIAVENENILQVMDGGFRINCRFTPQKLVELTKMDGAIILSKDLKKINYSNVLLTPDSRIKTLETGTRHKAAERTAKQMNTLVIAISERKNQITLYYKNLRYLLNSTEDILRKANENIQLLEKQRELFDRYLERLNRAEVQTYHNVNLAVNLIQKGYLIQKIAEELKKYTIELGKEGTLLKIRLKEIKAGVEKETSLIIKDYTNLDVKKSSALLDSLSYDELLDESNIFSALFYENHSRTEPVKGWRLLARTSLEEPEMYQVIKKAESLPKILNINAEYFADVISQEKSLKLKDELKKIKLGY